MPRYRCLIHGQNYVLRRDRSNEKSGFWTTRDVQSPTIEKAADLAIQSIRDDEYLAEFMVPELSQEAVLEVDKISRLVLPVLRKPKGFTFYQDTEEEMET